MNNSFFSKLEHADTGHQYALALAGQASAWRQALNETLSRPHTADQVRQALSRARALIQPIGLDLLTSAPGAEDYLNQVLAEETSTGPFDHDPAVSVVGITLAQLGALLDLEGTGLNVHRNPPVAVEGHSQGILGAALAKAFIADDASDMDHVLALAVLIGHAASAVARRLGATPTSSGTPMLSVRGLSRSALDTDLEPAIVNGPNAFVFSGRVNDLEVLKTHIEGVAARHNQSLADHQLGGMPIAVAFDFLNVGAPFHCHLLEDALNQVDTWMDALVAAGVDFDQERGHRLAAAILTQPMDWGEDLEAARSAGARWILDLGPGASLTRMSQTLLEGTGATMVDASGEEARAQLDTAGFEVAAPTTWDRFKPTLKTLPDGRVVVDTKFTRLTGRSPIMLPGMTPTTVTPELVAAAANAGNWTEMAGGGQYSEEVFHQNNRLLNQLLEPGRAAGFNAMFFDRYMWNLQFGVTKVVSKARQAGAHFDSVTIAAGIPEVDEAGDLLSQLTADGFTFVCFKPGTAGQIETVINIARTYPDFSIIMQVEDGRAGGHHSWEDRDALVLKFYAEIREVPNLTLTVGGGIGTPERAADYLLGTWSRAFGRPDMPVDGVFIGTAAMACLEAPTNEDVKQKLLELPGIDPETWVGQGLVGGGITSGLSHLDADMYEVENSSSKAARLIRSLSGKQENIDAHREEIIQALNKTAKPYFGDLGQMTYAQWATHLVELTFPSVDWTWSDRVLDVFQRIEARLNPADHGPIRSLFATIDDVEDAPAALQRLLEAYPSAATETVSPADSAWWPTLCRKHVKPLPFVPVLDTELPRWWGTDTLWQSQDPRFNEDQVRIIPGPISVGGIDRINEPVGDMFTRWEDTVAEHVGGEASAIFSRLGDAKNAEEFLRHAPNMDWNGNLVDNPAFVSKDATVIVADQGGVVIRVVCDSRWDQAYQDQPVGKARPHYVRFIDIPVILHDSCHSGGYPVVDMARLSVTAYDMLAATAGVGTTTVNGDTIDAMPNVEPGEGFGTVHTSFTYTANLGLEHGAVTGGALSARLAPVVPDALVGPSWPAIYAALGSARYQDVPVIEGLVNAVHLDQTVRLLTDLPADGTRVEVTSWCESLIESSSGRVVTVHVNLAADGLEFAHLIERFAIRGRVTSQTPPPPAPLPAPDATIQGTPRSFIRSVSVKAPADMTAFANVSGDFNPIHTSYAAAALSGLKAPLVHGMWLSATAEHTVCATDVAGLSAAPRLGVIRSAPCAPMTIKAWVYEMFGMVQLGDTVDITVERVGRTDGGDLAIEATCRVGDQVVSVGHGVVGAPTTAYIYPGQGIQRAGMGMDHASPAMRAVWARADQHTRQALGFSIEAIVRDNPTQIVVGGERLRHPEGILNLTQFTQVALATLAYAQTEDLRERGALASGAFYAGHSLGEYNALAAYAKVFELEDVLDIVFSRGSAMHHLVQRDAQGRSNYAMGALRPNQFGIRHEQVRDYIAQIARDSGEFLEVVNENLRDSQYAIAGTLAGLDALQRDAFARAKQAGGKAPFMLIPGIDVPFHSSALRPGVPAFREKLLEALPEDLNYQVLVGHYVPNLVARPFELTREFAQAMCDVVPSELVADLVDHWDTVIENPTRVARILLVELLAWQFASPVRWIETQELLFTTCGVQRAVEVGLGSAPTLANLAEKTRALIGGDFEVLNVERDQARVLFEDVQAAPSSAPADAVEPEVSGASAGTGASAGQMEGNQAGEASSTGNQALAPSPAASSAPAAAPAPTGGGISGADAPNAPVKASDAVRVLLAFATKVNLDQIDAADTVDTLTNGVSSKRNQLLMDMSAELGVPSIEGAAEAGVKDLLTTVDATAGNYQAFGPVLSEAISAKTRTLLGAAGLRPAFVGTRVKDTWHLPDSWVSQVSARVLLGTRDGDSVRGGSLATLPVAIGTQADAEALVDAAIAQVAADLGIQVSLNAGSAGGGGEVVDSAALNELREQLLGVDGVLAEGARHLLKQLGLEEKPDQNQVPGGDAELAAAVEAELGAGWLKSVTGTFDPARAVLFDDRWALAREDLARIASGQLDAAEVLDETLQGGGETLADLARWYGDNYPDLAETFARIADLAGQPAAETFSKDVAVVTGGAPHSIAAAVVERLLQGGATVVMTSSRVNQARLTFAKDLYRRNAAMGAKLWLVPANLASFRDTDQLIEWIGGEQTEVVGAETKLIKPALLPTLFFPFAAPPVHGTLGEDPAGAVAQTRLLVFSVERAIKDLAELGTQTAVNHRVHVVLPGSPNRGIFGGDGAYGESKAAFDAIVNKWSVESGWPTRVTFAHPKIGWVMGTGLMGGNDILVPAAKAAGVDVFSTEEIVDRLMTLVTAQARRDAAVAPLDADFTGGLADAGINLAELAAQERAAQAAQAAQAENAGREADAVGASSMIAALPNVTAPTLADRLEFDNVHTSLHDQVVIVGLGEVGTWGSRRTRVEAENGENLDLTAAGILEMAWMMGLVSWVNTPTTGWVDTDGNPVAESDIFDRYHDEVLARSGIRRLSDDDMIIDAGSNDVATLFLESDQVFTVGSRADAENYVLADPSHTQIWAENGEWKVLKLAGSAVRVPRRATLTRTVGGQIPEGFDPAQWGIPANMLDSIDRITIWNLVTAVDAFLSSGFTPAELLRAVHPGDVSSTQGTGVGGMDSLRDVFLSRFLDEDRASDILQEALPNVIAAHVMQAFVGGYGQMIHPVAACATAAVSVEEAVDKIRLGKSAFVVAGGIDDISVESLQGFGDMNATANTAEMQAKGIDDRFISRAGDRRRGGFLEAQGGGTVLVTRGDLAADLGLPVMAVVGYAQSFADGAHTSIPAPGLGALAAARGGTRSGLAHALSDYGLSVDDVAVVSKHDTSTNANDPNEAELHSRICQALERQVGNPLYVISQKTLTGHTKAGAAVFQICGLADLFVRQVIPGNLSLDCLDPVMAEDMPLLWLRSPLDMSKKPVKAGVLTSLGFGHVGGLVLLVHPGAFESQLAAERGGDAADQWRERATGRLQSGRARLDSAMRGGEPLFTPIEGRRLPDEDTHLAEVRMLLDPDARLGGDGRF